MKNLISKKSFFLFSISFAISFTAIVGTLFNGRSYTPQQLENIEALSQGEGIQYYMYECFGEYQPQINFEFIRIRICNPCAKEVNANSAYDLKSCLKQI